MHQTSHNIFPVSSIHSPSQYPPPYIIQIMLHLFGRFFSELSVQSCVVYTLCTLYRYTYCEVHVDTVYNTMYNYRSFLVCVQTQCRQHYSLYILCSLVSVDYVLCTLYGHTYCAVRVQCTIYLYTVHILCSMHAYSIHTVYLKPNCTAYLHT